MRLSKFVGLNVVLLLWVGWLMGCELWIRMDWWRLFGLVNWDWWRWGRDGNVVGLVGWVSGGVWVCGMVVVGCVC